MKTLLYGWNLADQLTEVNILAVMVAILIVVVIYLLIKSKRHSERLTQLDTFIKDLCKFERTFTQSEVEKIKTEIKSNYNNLIFKINSASNDVIFNKKMLEIENRFEKIEQQLIVPPGSEKITHKRNDKGQFEKLT